MTKEQQILLSFDYHKPTQAQADRIEKLRTIYKIVASEVFANCPDSADRTAALRYLHESMMTANKSIACEDDK